MADAHVRKVAMLAETVRERPRGRYGPRLSATVRHLYPKGHDGIPVDRTSAPALLWVVLLKDPLRASAWAELGAVYTGMKRYAEAIRTLRHLGEFAPDNVQVWGLLGAALEASGDRAEAEKAFRRHVQVDPEDWKSRRTLAQFLMREGRAAEAAPEFEKAAQLAPPKGSVERDREE